MIPQNEDEAAEMMDNGRNTGGGKMRAMNLPADTIKTKDAGEAIFYLFEVFSVDDQPDAWVDELKSRWPDLAAALFTAAHDE